MRTIPLRRVFEGICGLLGCELVTPGSPDFQGIVASINRWLPRGWEYDWWPEFMTVERRAYRKTWNSTDTFAAGAEVFFEGDELYYTANAAPNNPSAGQSPETDPDRWTELTGFARYVGLDQEGQTPIGEVKRVCRNDPDVQPQAPGEVRFDVTRLGIVPDSRAGARVYVEFRRRPPVFSASEYSAETAYAAGDLVFHEDTWECYRALQATTGNAPTDEEYWAQVEMPALLQAFIEQACYADALKADGAADKARQELHNEAFGFLLQAQDVVFGQQGQSATVGAVSY